MTLKGPDGRQKLYLGLSFGNLDRFRQAPLNTFIEVRGAELDLPIDVVLFSGPTEEDMAEVFAGKIGPDTKVAVSRRKRN